MKYQGCLLAVKDISASKHFYEKVLHQKAIMDMLNLLVWQWIA